MTYLIISNILLWIATISLVVLSLALLRQIGVIYERIAPAGALAMNSQIKAKDKAPVVEAKSLAGTNVSVGKPKAGKSQLLFFMSPECPVCKDYLPVALSVSKAEHNSVDLLLVSDGDLKHEEYVKQHKLPAEQYILSELVGKTYGVSKLPFAVLIDKNGIISSLGIVNSREHLESLFNAQEMNVSSIQEYLEAASDKDGALVKHA